MHVRSLSINYPSDRAIKKYISCRVNGRLEASMRGSEVANKSGWNWPINYRGRLRGETLQGRLLPDHILPSLIIHIDCTVKLRIITNSFKIVYTRTYLSIVDTLVLSIEKRAYKLRRYCL